MANNYDIIIIGAGISGIGMACHLAQKAPGKSMLILERRDNIGGTWDLFRYPGVRSDSDMMSFSFEFRPWDSEQVLADGASIKAYLKETADEYDIFSKIRFGVQADHANWSSAEKRWTLNVSHPASDEKEQLHCQFLISGAGYYDHEQGYLPEFPGKADFQGQFIHPQHWPEHLDYTDKKVVVIGSGATAVTLVPAMAEEAAHVTMLQRSPGYIFAIPAKDKLLIFLRKYINNDTARSLSRKLNITIQRIVYKLSRRFPGMMRRFLLKRVEARLHGKADMADFTPDYMPWDQRLAAVPRGDLFKVIRSGKASVVTDKITTFTESGITLASGKQLDADIIIAATGLNLKIMGGMTVSIDGETQTIQEKMTYKGVLIQDIPNMAYLFGYTNAAWTLKVDMAADYLCRLFNEMDYRNARLVVPHAIDETATNESIMDSLNAGYIRRGQDALPRQGSSPLWRVQHHLEKDKKMFKRDVVDYGLKWG